MKVSVDNYCEIGGALVGAAVGLSVASGLTTTVVGSTVAVCAVSSATIMTSGGALVVSKVAMGLFGKIIIGTGVAVCVGIGVSLAAKAIYDHYQTTENNINL